MQVDANELKVTNLVVRQQPVFTQGGRVENRKIVTFYIGSHGPFEKQYRADEYTPEKAKSDIETEVRNLRTLMENV